MVKNSSNTTKALFAGLLLGAAIGVLYAPEKGKKTRKKIKKTLKQGKSFLSGESEEIADTFISYIEDLEQQVEETIKIVIHEGKEKAEEFINNVEEKLAQFLQNSKPNT